MHVANIQDRRITFHYIEEIQTAVVSFCNYSLDYLAVPLRSVQHSFTFAPVLVLILPGPSCPGNYWNRRGGQVQMLRCRNVFYNRLE